MVDNEQLKEKIRMILLKYSPVGYSSDNSLQEIIECIADNEKKKICSYCGKELEEAFTSFPYYEVRYKCSCINELENDYEFEIEKLKNKIAELEDEIIDLNYGG